MRIRKVEEKDLEQIARLELSGFSEDKAASAETFEYRIKVFPDSFFVAEEGNTIIGFINGCVSNQAYITDNLYELDGGHDQDGWNQLIFGLVVHPEYQNLGIGGSLLNHIIRAAKHKKRKRVVLTCEEELIDFYEAFGFQNNGISDSKIGGITWYDMSIAL